ncbi:hypothetical protein HPP92_021982 [Vanilla planifolia]|uniref:Uncharacterized protein n=1 Tax=Vanilla planifolia TaxID=51239 RepID=A0A835PZY6_VANPL|nr:hypothetical protein HPP92_021982 [Vanilla planifolia]
MGPKKLLLVFLCIPHICLNERTTTAHKDHNSNGSLAVSHLPLPVFFTHNSNNSSGYNLTFLHGNSTNTEARSMGTLQYPGGGGGCAGFLFVRRRFLGAGGHTAGGFSLFSSALGVTTPPSSSASPSPFLAAGNPSTANSGPIGVVSNSVTEI